jgi:hypothetical protein
MLRISGGNLSNLRGDGVIAAGCLVLELDDSVIGDIVKPLEFKKNFFDYELTIINIQ